MSKSTSMLNQVQPNCIAVIQARVQIGLYRTYTTSLECSPGRWGRGRRRRPTRRRRRCRAVRSPGPRRHAGCCPARPARWCWSSADDRSRRRCERSPGPSPSEARHSAYTVVAIFYLFIHLHVILASAAKGGSHLYAGKIITMNICMINNNTKDIYLYSSQTRVIRVLFHTHDFQFSFSLEII